MKLFRGAAPVTVHAADVALLNLPQHIRPAFRHDQECDRLPLLRWVAVIELEHEHVRLAAVDARMIQQVLEDIAAVLFPPTFDLKYGAANIVRLIRNVMGVAIRSVTLTTDVLPLSRSYVSEGECSHGLVFMANRAK